MSDAEAVEMGRHLVRLVDSELIFIMHDGTEAVGAGIVVPDINPILKRLNGSFGGLGFLKALWYRRFLTGFRGLIFGIRREYQNLGLPLVAFDYLYNTLYSVKKFRRYYYLELGWNLEDNDQINQWYLDGGVKPTKRYRVYRREL